MSDIPTAEINTFSIRQEGAKVILIYNGKLLCDLTPEAGELLAKAIYTQAKKAEEWANAEKIVFDQAILTRLGLPLGLTNHPVLLKEATKEAAWNSQLRRHIPLGRAGGIKSQTVFGTPAIIKDKENNR